MLVISWPMFTRPDHPPHLVGIVDLEGVVQREGVDVDDARRQPRLGQQRHLVLDQLPLGGDQQHRHLEPLAVRIQDLEIELHVLHVERNVLLGLPADHLAGVRLFHPVHLDLLDDHVAPADRDHHLLGLDPGRGQETLDGIRDDARGP